MYDSVGSYSVSSVTSFGSVLFGRFVTNKVLDHFQILMSRNLFDIICLNVTFCDGSITDDEITLPNYSIVRKDRNRHGGGVAMYIRNSLTFIRREDLETDDVECIWLKSSVNKGSLSL